jgi:hypothetical protein
MSFAGVLSSNDSYEFDLDSGGVATKYLSIIGQLIWFCRARPAIASAVNRLSTRSSQCADKDYSASKRVVRHLKFTRDPGITFKPESAESDEPVRFVAWAEALIVLMWTANRTQAFALHSAKIMKS